jgi:hypothetical protein
MTSEQYHAYRAVAYGEKVKANMATGNYPNIKAFTMNAVREARLALEGRWRREAKLKEKAK